MTQYTRLGIILSIAILAVVCVFSLPPLPQDPEYHDFADQRAFLGIPDFCDVVSNLAFLIVGSAGLVFLKSVWSKDKPFADASEKWLWLALFSFIVLTSLGSAYYHWKPDNPRLVWDRLFIALTLTTLLSIVIVERRLCGWWIFPLLALYSMASVVYWGYTEQKGAGDLRPYILAQFFPMVAIPAICVLFPAHPGRFRELLFAFCWYVLAKLCEHFDQGVFEVIGVSGHTLKHLTAGVGAFCLLRHLKRGDVLRTANSSAL